MNNQNNAAPCPGVDAQAELPFAWYLRTGHGNAIHFGTEPPDCLLSHEWKPVYERPAPTSVYAAGKVERLIKAAPYIHDSAVTNTGYGLLVELILTREELDEYRAALAALAEGDRDG